MESNSSPVLHKPTGTIQIANQFTLTERKLFNALIYHSQINNRVSADEQTIAQSEVFTALGWTKSKNTEDLKSALRKLTGTTVEWNEFGVDKAQTWTVCTFLSSGKLARGSLRYRLNPEIVDQIRRPTLFAKMQLLVQGQFSKRYSLVLYEFLLDWISRRQEKELVIPPIDLGHLQRLLGAEAKSYSGPTAYKFFNRDVLRPAVKEINAHSDLTVECLPKRERRRVVALGFAVARKDTFQLAFDLEGPLGPTQHEEENKEDLVELLVNQGVTKRQARTLCRTYDRDRIEGNAAYLDRLVRSGKSIDNRGAWLGQAIRDDYRPKVSKAELEERAATKEAAEKHKQAQIAASAAEREEALKGEWDRFRHRRMRESFEAKPKRWRLAREKEFSEKLQSEGSAGLKLEFSRKKFESVLVQLEFYKALEAELLSEPHEISFESYQQWTERS